MNEIQYKYGFNLYNNGYVRNLYLLIPDVGLFIFRNSDGKSKVELSTDDYYTTYATRLGTLERIKINVRNFGLIRNGFMVFLEKHLTDEWIESVCNTHMRNNLPI